MRPTKTYLHKYYHTNENIIIKEKQTNKKENVEKKLVKSIFPCS